MPDRNRTTARRTILTAAFATLIVLGPGTALNAQAPSGSIGRTTILFNDDILGDLGITLIGVNTTAPSYRDGSLGFGIKTGGWLEYTEAEVNTAGFSAGSLHHDGGFTLAFNDLELSINGFELRAAAEPFAFDLFDTQGKRWFRLGSMQYELSPDGSELRLINTDMLLSPEFASILGRDDLANSYLAVIDMVVPVDLPRRRAVSLGAIAAGVDCPVPNVGQPVDIALSGLDSVTQLAREAGGRVAIAASADLTNVGNNSVEWFQTITPDDVPSDIGPHPYLSLHFYKLANGRLTELGQSDVKHAFLSINSGCPCAAGHTIYPGCADRYGAFLNGQRIHLAPRDGVSAFTGAWSRVGSHFDSYNQTLMSIDPTLTDDVRSHAGDEDHDDSFEHRLTVQEPDLMDSNAQYYYEAWYVVADDSNIMNSMGHRQVVPSLVGSVWSFPLATTLTEGSIVDEFVNPAAIGVGQDTDLIDTGQGRYQIAVRTSNQTNGSFHYEYVIRNFDFDRQIRTFTVPLAFGVTATNVVFDDVDANLGNDWSISVNQGVSITWTAPVGNALDWGTLYNFAFDSNVPAAPGNVTVTALEAGAALAAVTSITPDPTGIPPPIGGNDACVDAFPVPLGTIAGTLEQATPDGDSSEEFDFGTEADVWYLYTPTSSGPIRIHTCGSNDLPGDDLGLDSVISVHSACPGNVGNQIDANDDYFLGSDPFACDVLDGEGNFLEAGDDLLDSSVSVNLTQGVPVRIRVSRIDPSVDGFLLTLEDPPSNDLIANASVLTVAGSQSGTIVGASIESFDFLEPDVWYAHTPAQTGTLLVDTCGTFASGGPDTVLSVHPFNDAATELAFNDDYEGGSNPIACDGPGGSFLDSAIAVEVTAGVPIHIRVSRFDATSNGAFTLNFDPSPPFGVTITATPSVIGIGGTSTLAWFAPNGRLCQASGGWTGSMPTSGLFDVTPSATTSYTLTCTDVSSANQLVDIAIVTVNALANDECTDSISIASLPMSLLSDTTVATANMTDPISTCSLGSDGATAWFSYQPKSSTDVTVSTIGSDYDTVLSVWPASQGCGNLTTQIACNDDEAGMSLQSEVTFAATGGIEYLIQVGSFAGDPGGRLTFRIPEPGSSAALIVALTTLAGLRHRRTSRRR